MRTTSDSAARKIGYSKSHRLSIAEHFTIHSLFMLLSLKLLFSVGIALGKYAAINRHIDVAFMVIVVFAVIKTGYFVSNFRGPILLLCSFLAIGIVSQLLNNATVFHAIAEGIRFVMPFFFFMALFYLYKQDRRLVLTWIVAILILVIVLAIAGLFFLPPMANHGELWSPTYFSGLHKSSYMLALVAMATFCLYKAMMLNRWLALGIGCISLWFVLFAWGIRTPMVMVTVFAAVYWYRQRGLAGRGVAMALSGMIIAFAVFHVAFYSSFSLRDANKVSSGRLNMWVKKVQMFDDASVTEKLLGRGYGSDKQHVQGWWGRKGSHNNFLRILNNYGVIGLISICSFFVLLAHKFMRIDLFYASLVAYFSSALLSNGLMFRPLPGLLFSLCLLVAISAHEMTAIAALKRRIGVAPPVHRPESVN